MTSETSKGGLQALFKSGAAVAPMFQKGALTSLLGGKPVSVSQPAQRPSAIWRPQVRASYIFDATGSRKPTWEEARKIHEIMILGSTDQSMELLSRLVYFGGLECVAFPYWTKDPRDIARFMADVSCATGNTQIITAINKTLDFDQPPTMIVLVGDCCEESLVAIEQIGKTLGERKIPVYAYLEKLDPKAADDNPQAYAADGYAAFTSLAKHSGGVFFPFGSKLYLGPLFQLATAHAAGGNESIRTLLRTNAFGGAARHLAHKFLALTST